MHLSHRGWWLKGAKGSLFGNSRKYNLGCRESGFAEGNARNLISPDTQLCVLCRRPAWTQQPWCQWPALVHVTATAVRKCFLVSNLNLFVASP